ncbi:hypothetical protein SAMN05216419_102325 [Nitrosomonas cryotolerans]|uniref:hypothetical protein n=1 Tax=Nitrosomonas cryotolerans TaxID=44575 RepID=UPI0008EDEF8E|nr:hypothetical protein [Nitrosomonas cryotolerans]SFP83457.1 hypothetical protein SAMN05216419_102325 [Nitrosomonas cryotolerans]
MISYRLFHLCSGVRAWLSIETLHISLIYLPEQAFEVIPGVTQKTLSNYTNHLLQTLIRVLQGFFRDPIEANWP